MDPKNPDKDPVDRGPWTVNREGSQGPTGPNTNPPPTQHPNEPLGGTVHGPRSTDHGPEDDEGGPPPPLTPMAWLLTNGPYLILFGGLAIWIFNKFGFEGLWRAALVTLGLGFVVFIHELGHFLAAKWCDVHVNTFSLGFGPSLPGCNFQRGETTYKIAVLPLGGYVSMVGEGLENEEDDNYPRSFKNKSVGQRMLIISAGVIMNVILGAICFIIVYSLHGVERQSPVVYGTEPGSPAWKKGIQTGSVITQLNDIKSPYYEDVRKVVALSDEDETVHMVFQPPSGEPRDIRIEPRRYYDDLFPVIGVGAMPSLQLYDERASKQRAMPVLYNSPAAFARQVNLQPGDVITAVDGPGGETVLKPDSGDASGAVNVAKLCEAMRTHAGKPLTLHVRRGNAAGDTEQVALQPGGFQWGDRVTGTTDPDASEQALPWQVKELPDDPNNDQTEACDPLEYYRRMQRLAGKPVVIRVQRQGSETPVDLLVGPAFHQTFGMRMKMGEVAGVRDDSPASKSGIIPASEGTKGDQLVKVEMIFVDQAGKELGKKLFEQLDPLRLPYQLRQAAQNRPVDSQVKVMVTVARDDRDKREEKGKEVTLQSMMWEDRWDLQLHSYSSPSAALAIPELGLAYRVQSSVDTVMDNSPAKVAGIDPHDRIEQIAVRIPGLNVEDKKWSSFLEIQSERIKEQKTWDQWVHHYFWTVQGHDYHDIKVYIRRGDNLLEEPKELSAVPDPDWPMVQRGLMFEGDTRVQKATGVVEALSFGVDKTVDFIQTIYLNLRSLILGRISVKTLGGPIEIATRSFAMARDPWILTLWLGLISVNLAVVNFLPIPILDGGHMVFLIYEKLRGKPPSEPVRAVATYIGLVIIASLMIFLFYQDIGRLWRGW